MIPKEDLRKTLDEYSKIIKDLYIRAEINSKKYDAADSYRDYENGKSMGLYVALDEIRKIMKEKYNL